MADDKAQLLRSLGIDRGTPPPPGTRTSASWGLLVAGLVVGAAAAVGVVWVLAPGTLPSMPKPAELQVAGTTSPAAQLAASLEPKVSDRLIASGYVVARRKATVAAEVTGKVVEVFVDEGMVVAADQPLARLNSALIERDLALAQSRVASADAAVASVAADLADAELVLNRTRSLSREDYASRADLSKAESHAGLLRAELKKAQAEAVTSRLDVRRSEELLSEYVIKAPFAGVVVDKSAQPGEMISPLSAGGGFTRTGICTLVDMDSIEVEVDVNEAFIGRVHPNQAVKAVLDAYPDWTIPASVIAIVPTANREKATVKVRIAFVKKDQRILPDMAVKVTFLEESKRDGKHAAD